MRAIALVDTDSYVKWGAALTAQLPATWRRSIAVVANPAEPSAAQLEAALAGSGFTGGDVVTVTLGDLAERMRLERPDVVIVAMRGPAASVVMRALAGLESRPVLVSGLPGISIPATWRALFYRAQADLVVLHSKHEVREFGILAARRGWTHRLGLATLPFIDRRAAAGGNDIVFAAQAIVPAHLDQRERMLEILIETARRNPGHRVVIKVRAATGEQQTHAEDHGFAVLLARRTGAPPNLVVASGPMSAALESAAGLVTVSSTALIEAVGRGVPAIAIGEFGVNPELINVVFAGSGLLGDGEDCAGLRFAHPAGEWLDDNDFHHAAENDWLPGVLELLDARAARELPHRPSLRVGAGGALRRAWEVKQAFGSHDRTLLGGVALVVGVPARMAVIALRRVGRALRRRGPLPLSHAPTPQRGTGRAPAGAAGDRIHQR